jgi:hypothetical protein
MSNEWLFISPKEDTFTALCNSAKFHLTLQQRGKMYLPTRCKGYTAHTTLYALSTITQNNSKYDILRPASVDLDCCLTEIEREQIQRIHLQKPLTNILSSMDELNLASVKVSEVQYLIDKEEAKRFEHFKVLTSKWGSVVATILILIIGICCSCCCCKCCRHCGFWLWGK